MGSIMMERSDEDDSIFPKNVSRVKIYPSIVNFIKQALAPPQVLKGRLTNQQLNRFADNVCDRYLCKLSSPACKEYKTILMAFRIECTMHLDDENYCLDKLKQQFQGMTKGILHTLQQKLRVTMIAVEDISNITTFCLGRYYKMCLGNGSTIFRDQKMARAMVLSLWHVVGYHCHKATTDAHKNYLINVDMDDYETVEGAPIKNLKSRGKQQNPTPRKDWSQTPKEAIQTVIDALTFMNLYEKRKKGSGETQWYYMYRKVCLIVIGKDTCPWCYSSVRRLREAAQLWTEPAKFGKQSLIACKSNHFSTLEELATDVTKRIEHHNTETVNVKDLIKSMFLPVLEGTRTQHTNILKDILNILRPNDAGREEGREVEIIEIDDFSISDHESRPAWTTGEGSEWFIGSNPTTAQNSQREDTNKEFANDKSSPVTTDVSSESISPGESVLARHSAESPWTQAYVLGCRGTQYMVEFFEAGAQHGEHQVSKENVKHFDWNYWKPEMKSWNYNDFKEQLQVTGGQCQEDSEQGKGLVALKNLPVGSVVVEHTKCTAYKEGNQAGAEKEYNCELLFIGSSPITAQNSQGEDTKVGFVVTTRQVQQGEKLKWLQEPDIIQSIMFSMQGDVGSSPVTTDVSSESISPGESVLARHSAESPWTQAYVLGCRGTQYMVEFFEAGAQHGEHQVSKENVKHFDWNYWKPEMKSWNYNDFKEQLQVTGGQCQEDSEQGKGLVALKNLPVGSVVVEHTKCTAYKEGNQAGAEKEYNCELLFIGSSPITAQNSQGEDTKVGFVVTTRQVQQGEKLKWLQEPDIIQSIMFSMQGDVSDARDSFDLHAYMVLWRLRMPSPSSQNITIASTAFETSDFGSSIKPFLHQATIDLLLMEDIANWLDIDANNSFVVHLAIAMNKNPLALHTMFARNCTRNLQAKQDRVWTPDVLAAVLPSSLNFKIVILVKQKADDTYTCKIYGSDMHDAEETPGSSVVLVQDGRNYSWLRATRIQDVNIKMFQHNSQYAVKWETLTKKSVFIRGCHNSETQAPVEWKNSVWNTACEKVGLIKSDTGKWLTKPPGFNLDLTFQDGSLTPQSFAELHDVLRESMTSGSVADLGSEAGHAVAQFAFMPFVNQVIGIEIQYAWVAYSVIMMQHLKSESYKHNHHMADIQIIHGSFLNTTLSEWEAALGRADLCFCNNPNWDKGSVSVPQGQQALTGEFRNKISVNVAHLLVDKMKFNSRVLVFDETSFTGQAYQVVKTLELRASWSTSNKATKVEILRMCPTHFKVLKKALQMLCQAKNCNFGSLPKDWWENEVNQSGEGFLRLNDHILKQDYFEKSNASVHLGWNVTAPMTVCIKKFPDLGPLWGKTKAVAQMQHHNIMQEIHILEIVAMNEDTSTHNVIRFLGTDVDRKGGTVLIFEMVNSSRFNSDLQSMTTQQIRDYMYRLLQALNYLHERNVVHRDVKPENFLHNFQSNTFRLIDFGSAEKGANGFVKTGGGTRGFRAPEILQGIATQTAAVDVWSAGIILLSLITGKPYILSQHDKNAKGNDVDALHLKEIEEIVGKTEIQQLNEGEEYGDGSQHESKTGWAVKALQSVITTRNWKNDDHALDLLSKMLNVQSSERITSADALKHPFFQSAMNGP